MPPKPSKSSQPTFEIAIEREIQKSKTELESHRANVNVLLFDMYPLQIKNTKFDLIRKELEYQQSRNPQIWLSPNNLPSRKESYNLSFGDENRDDILLAIKILLISYQQLVKFACLNVYQHIINQSRIMITQFLNFCQNKCDIRIVIETFSRIFELLELTFISESLEEQREKIKIYRMQLLRDINDKKMYICNFFNLLIEFYALQIQYIESIIYFVTLFYNNFLAPFAALRSSNVVDFLRLILCALLTSLFHKSYSPTIDTQFVRSVGDIQNPRANDPRHISFVFVGLIELYNYLNNAILSIISFYFYDKSQKKFINPKDIPDDERNPSIINRLCHLLFEYYKSLIQTFMTRTFVYEVLLAGIYPLECFLTAFLQKDFYPTSLLASISDCCKYKLDLNEAKRVNNPPPLIVTEDTTRATQPSPLEDTTTVSQSFSSEEKDQNFQISLFSMILSLSYYGFKFCPNVLFTIYPSFMKRLRLDHSSTSTENNDVDLMSIDLAKQTIFLYLLNSLDQVSTYFESSSIRKIGSEITSYEIEATVILPLIFRWYAEGILFHCRIDRSSIDSLSKKRRKEESQKLSDIFSRLIRYNLDQSVISTNSHLIMYNTKNDKPLVKKFEKLYLEGLFEKMVEFKSSFLDAFQDEITYFRKLIPYESRPFIDTDFASVDIVHSRLDVGHPLADVDYLQGDVRPQQVDVGHLGGDTDHPKVDVRPRLSDTSQQGVDIGHPKADVSQQQAEVGPPKLNVRPRLSDTSQQRADTADLQGDVRPQRQAGIKIQKIQGKAINHTEKVLQTEINEFQQRQSKQRSQSDQQGMKSRYSEFYGRDIDKDNMRLRHQSIPIFRDIRGHICRALIEQDIVTELFQRLFPLKNSFTYKTTFLIDYMNFYHKTLKMKHEGVFVSDTRSCPSIKNKELKVNLEYCKNVVLSDVQYTDINRLNTFFIFVSHKDHPKVGTQEQNTSLITLEHLDDNSVIIEVACYFKKEAEGGAEAKYISCHSNQVFYKKNPMDDLVFRWLTRILKYKMKAMEKVFDSIMPTKVGSTRSWRDVVAKSTRRIVRGDLITMTEDTHNEWRYGD